MSQTQDTNSERVKSMQEANADRHYILLVIAIIIGLVGVYLRFADFRHASAVANVILALGAGVALKAVFDIIS
ncbi:hypothetical protein [Mucilaginibacter sp. dw_454]|uniref:hypothetical protein n=1 Tax=Mucilaginibacter sp. dw_454 TaxID=2720079 RepID=UPI001BD5D135|nr:hypothetical protein [Mucilaginibacter sp. dw_454]